MAQQVKDLMLPLRLLGSLLCLGFDSPAIEVHMLRVCPYHPPPKFKSQIELGLFQKIKLILS